MGSDETPERIKLAARRLFAQRGIDGVSVRDIVAAAGQKNNGSLHYYFRSKDALVRELVREGAMLIEARRQATLDALEAAGGPNSIREIIEILVWPSLNLGRDLGEDTYLRFITILQMGHRDLFMAGLEKRWNVSYQRCLSHIRRLLPHIPAPILNQRLVFLTIELNAILSARETSPEGDQANRHRFWAAPSTLENFIDTLQAGLEKLPSPKTAQLAASEAKTRVKRTAGSPQVKKPARTRARNAAMNSKPASRPIRKRP